jgi:transcriptional regulator with XRE-family HTH domain
MTDFKSLKIKQVLKTLLKKRGLTYEAVAEQLECSVPTVKRFLGAEELTLSRLLEICEIVNIDFAELHELTKEAPSGEEHFTPEQEAFLAKNPAYLGYLMKLFSGETPKQIAVKYGLSMRSTDKYLIGLEKNELIHVTGKQKVKPAFKSVPRFGEGPLGQLHFQSVIANSARFFTEVAKDGIDLKRRGLPADERPHALWGIHATKVTRPTFDRYVAETERARLDFDRQADFEEKTKPPEELMTMVVLGGHTILKNESPHLQILENMFGEIKNL